MKTAYVLSVLTCLLAGHLTTLAHASDRTILGYGDLFTNDALGDGQDRWRTASYAFSAITGPQWSGQAPYRFGELIEYRVRADILAPDNLTTPASGDRRYAGALSVGAHSHMRRGETDYRLGVDLVVTGPQTGLGEFQATFHDWIGLAEPQVLSNQIGDAAYPTLSGEVSRNVQIGGALHLRPFAEVQAGAETLLRVGGDIVVGNYGRGDLLLRDTGSGQLYPGIRGSDQGVSFLMGADVAAVSDSVYLPTDLGYVLEDTRTRLRAGVNVLREEASIFYGVTWLSEEFEAQGDAQTVGSLQLRLRF